MNKARVMLGVLIVVSVVAAFLAFKNKGGYVEGYICNYAQQPATCTFMYTYGYTLTNLANAQYTIQGATVTYSDIAGMACTDAPCTATVYLRHEP